MHDAAIVTGWMALAYAVVCNQPSQKALQYFCCTPDERKPVKTRKALKTERVLCVIREYPDESLQWIAEKAGCSVALVENVIISARRKLRFVKDEGYSQWEKKVLEKNAHDPTRHYGKIASDLQLDRKKVRLFLLQEVGRLSIE